MAEPILNREALERAARAVGAHAYTNRFLTGQPAFAFTIERLETFAEALVLSAIEKAHRERDALLCQALQALEHARDHIGTAEPKPAALCDVEAAIEALDGATGGATA